MTGVDELAQRALLAGGMHSRPGRGDIDAVRRMLQGPVTGAVGTAGAALRRLFDKGWITVTGADGRWRADITPLGVRAAAETTPHLIDRTATGDVGVPALCWAGTHVGDEIRLAVLRDIFKFTDVTALVYEPDGDGPGRPDVRVLTASGERWLSQDPLDMPASDLEMGGVVLLSAGKRDTICAVMASFAERHGPSVAVDLVDGQVVSPVADADRQMGPWVLAVPPALGRAMMYLTSGPLPGSDAEFLHWVSADIPPIRLRCGYRNGAPADEGTWHQVLVVGTDIVTPGHSGPAREDDGSGEIRNACRAAAVALTSSGRIEDLAIARHRDAKGNERTMPVNQMQRLELIRTVLLAARWLQDGWTLADVAPLLKYGPGPDEASPLLERGVPAERLAEWAGYDLGACVQWEALPDIPAELAWSLLRAGLAPAAVSRWTGQGVPAAHLLQWFALVAADIVAEDEIPAWEALGIEPTTYQKLNRPDYGNRLTPERCRQWLDAGIPAKHIRVYEYAKASPTDLASYGEALSQSDPWEVVRALGLLADSEAQVPIDIIAKYVGRGYPPYTAVFLEGDRFPMTEAARRRAADAPWAVFERVTAPRIDWSAAAIAIRTGRPTPALFTVLSLRSAPEAWLIGTHHNYPRTRRLFARRPAGHDDEGRPWHVGVLYPAPYDLVYDVEDLVGVATLDGHVACLSSRFLRPFIEALANSGIHFVVPITPHAGPEDEPDPDRDELQIAVRLPRPRELKEQIELTAPPNVHWAWPEWR